MTSRGPRIRDARLLRSILAYDINRARATVGVRRIPTDLLTCFTADDVHRTAEREVSGVGDHRCARHIYYDVIELLTPGCCSMLLPGIFIAGV